MKKVCLIGGSGHAKVIIDTIECKMVADPDSETSIIGFLDDDLKKTDLLGYKRLGSLDDINRLCIDSETCFIVSIGDNHIRKAIAQNKDLQWYTAVHPSALISKHAAIGSGSVIMAGAVVNAGAVIGKHAIINTNAVVEHDCKISDFVHISPNATLCGSVSVGEGSHIGAGATIIQNKRVGSNTIIGAGAVVVRDIPDNTVAKGVPAK